ncbi:glycosyltransferase family 9 protein [Streptomyces somaliensis]|uniref:glycosyltransferase family 9 protein n=1 Tax=Streptomyces somaliensis TaxID=78355 RepID=UPI003F753189
MVHPGADAAARRWPPERYARVVRELRRRGHRVVLTGGPGEDGLLARVAGPAGLGEGDVLAGGLPYGRLAALCAGAAAVVSGDTGVAHVAVAYGTPSVTLFGPVPPHLWGPPPDARHVALWHPGPPGDPHGREPDPRLLRIGPDEVLAALLPHLGASRARPPERPVRPPA